MSKPLAETMSPFGDIQLAYALFRLTLGVNLLMHGVARLIGDTQAFVAGMVQGFETTILPTWSVEIFATLLPWIEAAIGLLLFIGLWTRGSLVAASLLITVLTFGTTLKQDWGTAGSQLLYALAVAVLLAGRAYNALSVDGWRQRASSRKLP